VDIRPVQEEDAVAAAVLCMQLGYSTDAAAVLARMRQIAGDRNRAVLVARLAEEVVGWIDLSVEYYLQSEPVALIGGWWLRSLLVGRALGCNSARLQRIGRASGVWLGCGSGRM